MIRELCEYSGKEFNEVRQRLRNRNIVSEEWEKANPKTEEEILQFYKEAESIIYGLGRWYTYSYVKAASVKKIVAFYKK